MAKLAPRSTLWVPNQGSEYSLYGSRTNPGYGRKVLAVHSHTQAGAGEARSVLALASARLRGAIRAADPDAHEALDTERCVAFIAERHPGWPIAEIDATLRSIDAMRFAPGTPEDALALYRQADALAGHLGGAG